MSMKSRRSPERSRVRSNSIDKTVVVYGFASLDERLNEFLAERRFQTLLLTLFSAMALILAGIGFYGLMHYSVAYLPAGRATRVDPIVALHSE